MLLPWVMLLDLVLGMAQVVQLALVLQVYRPLEDSG